MVDASHPRLDEHVEAVEDLLGELELRHRPLVVALNKVDRLAPGPALRALVERFDGVPVSARTGQGVDGLVERIARTLASRVARARLRIPYGDGAALALCYERGRVLSRSDDPDGIRLDVEAAPRLLGKLAAYRDDQRAS